MIISTGCSVYEPEERNLQPSELTKTFRLFEESETNTEMKWWKAFNDSELNSLIEAGLQNNLDIQQARASLKQAQAALDKASGSKFPSVSGGLDASRKRTPGSEDTDSYSFDLSASYELDLWGRVDSLVEAERLDFKATQADLETARISVAGSIAQTWLDIITTRKEKEIVKLQLENNSALLDLINFRFEHSMANALDSLQQQETVASTRAGIPLLEAKEQVLLNNLALLLGMSSSDKLQINRTDLPKLPPFPALGIPADLLKFRPDIKSAQFNLISSDWDVAAARANRLPALNLTGGYGYSASEMSLLFDNWFISLGASLAATLFDGGTKSAEVRRLEAGVEAELAAYREAVFQAVMEVENSIINEKKQKEYVTLLEEQYTLAKQTLTEAERQYTNGLQSFIPVITELPKVHTLEKRLISEKAKTLKYRIALYRALGNRWTEQWKEEK